LTEETPKEEEMMYGKKVRHPTRTSGYPRKEKKKKNVGNTAWEAKLHARAPFRVERDCEGAGNRGGRFSVITGVSYCFKKRQADAVDHHPICKEGKGVSVPKSHLFVRVKSRKKLCDPTCQSKFGVQEKGVRK